MYRSTFIVLLFADVPVEWFVNCCTPFCEMSMQRRLDAMLYIGLTEKHQESATMFVSLVGDQVSVQLEALKDTVQQNTSDPG